MSDGILHLSSLRPYHRKTPRIELNDATDKSHGIWSMEKTIYSQLAEKERRHDVHRRDDMRWNLLERATRTYQQARNQDIRDLAI
jgi:hypothetical protein